MDTFEKNSRFPLHMMRDLHKIHLAKKEVNRDTVRTVLHNAISDVLSCVVQSEEIAVIIFVLLTM